MGYLRITLAWCVFISHLDALPWLHAKAGEAAVTCFFVLSGYVLAYVYDKRFKASGSLVSDSVRFFTIRWMSLAAPYFLVVGSYFVLILAQSWRSGHPYRPLDLYLAQMPGWSWAHQLAFGFSNVAMLGLNAFGWRWLIDPPTWTMGVEAVFWLCAAATMRLSRRALCLWALALLVLDVAWGSSRSPLLHAEFFVLGVLVWLWARGRGAPALGAAQGRLVGLALSGVVLALLLSGSALALIVSPLLVAAAIPYLPLRSAADPVDCWLGRASFAFYLVHVPCLNLSSVLLHRHAGEAVTWIYSLVAWGLSMGLAGVITWFVPQPDTSRFYRGWTAAGRPAKTPQE